MALRCRRAKVILQTLPAHSCLAAFGSSLPRGCSVWFGLDCLHWALALGAAICCKGPASDGKSVAAATDKRLVPDGLVPVMRPVAVLGTIRGKF